MGYIHFPLVHYFDQHQNTQHCLCSKCVSYLFVLHHFKLVLLIAVLDTSLSDIIKVCGTITTFNIMRNTCMGSLVHQYYYYLQKKLTN